jgi:hypothetical protein
VLANRQTVGLVAAPSPVWIVPFLGAWVGRAPDDSILAPRDTSDDEILAFEPERP